MPGIDLPGQDYNHYEIDGGPQACQKACANELICQAFTWVPSGSKGICWLKNLVPGKKVKNSSYVSGVRYLLPQGLTGGLTYWNPGESVVIGLIDKFPTIDNNKHPNSKPGWQVRSDGDRGLSASQGFYHQELTSVGGGIRGSSYSFILPAGTVCGFHHTQNTPTQKPHMDPQKDNMLGTCMGADPSQNGCPSGWVPRRHFDMSSGDGSQNCNAGSATSVPYPEHCGYFAWCEYQDPLRFCDEDPNCIARATKMTTIGIQSNVDPNGGTVRPTCPNGTVRTSFYDSGRSSGQGLSFCSNSSAPAISQPSTGSSGLTWAYYFSEPTTSVQWNIKVSIKGECTNPTGDGAKTFEYTRPFNGPGNGDIAVGDSYFGLAPGTWRVHAYSDVNSTVINCSATVPGYAGFSIQHGQPQCTLGN